MNKNVFIVFCWRDLEILRIYTKYGCIKISDQKETRATASQLSKQR